MKKRRRVPDGTRYLIKWIAVIAACLILGGTLSFYLILLTADALGEAPTDKIWAVGMVPLMTLLAIPVTAIVARQVSKNLARLTEAMHEVSEGNLDVYLPTAKAKDFKKVYGDFNKMTEEIRGVDALRSDVIDLFSHELKTPIASINGFARLLLDERDEEKRKRYAEVIVKESDRLSSLAKNALLFTKIDAQRIDSDKEVYNLADQLREVAIALEPVWSEREIEFSAELSDAPIYADRELTESLWRNLLDNAFKFTPRHGEIRLAMRVGGGSVAVAVADTGRGIPEEELPRVFERRFRGGGASAASGNGLGLTIARRIAALADGAVSVSSKVGEGSVFTVTLPLRSDRTA